MKFNNSFMKIFLTSVTSLIFIFLAVKQFLNNRKTVYPDDSRTKMALYVDLSVIFHIVSHAVSRRSIHSDFPCCIIIGLISISVLSMSLFAPGGLASAVVWTAVSMEIFSALWMMVSSFADIPAITAPVCLIISIVPCCVIAVMYIYGIYRRLSDVKYVMKSGSVWTNLTLSVDSVYLAFILMTTMLYGTISAALPEENPLCITFFTFVYISVYVALSIRILNSSAFVIMTEHERRIIESMKIAHGDNARESAGTMMLYKNIYDRVLDYFTECKPYLNPKLTISDVVEVVFSNKLYISKAISQCTGRNFCQFVNYYRVMYAVELFRSDPTLKVLELATKCGFNSVVSFGMAFRLYMGEKPGDWCRREKFRLEKLKK